MVVMEPFTSQIDLRVGLVRPAAQVIKRHLSDMPKMYADAGAVERILKEEGDRLIYEVHVADVPEEEGQLLYCTTIIYPGRVGDEFHMTKGHFHVKRDRAEIYLGLTGEGYLLLQTDDGALKSIPLRPGTVAYVPPFWAHRTVNTDHEPFTFFATYPGDAGHDYGTIERTGFVKLMVARNGQAVLTDNLKYKLVRR